MALWPCMRLDCDTQEKSTRGRFSKVSRGTGTSEQRQVEAKVLFNYAQGIVEVN